MRLKFPELPRRAAEGGFTRGRRVLAYVLLIAVMGSVAAMSWAGLYAFAHQTMHWTPAHAVLVPVALDIAAMACALLALDSISNGENAATLRALTACFVGLSAFVNWRHAIATGNPAEQLFFPAMSVLAYLLVHAVMAKTRREIRHEQQTGSRTRRALEPLPRTGVLAWLLFPARTFGAVRAAVGARIPERGELLEPREDLTGLSQSDAIRRGIAAVGPQPRQVLAWLDRNGWPGVQPQRVYDVMRRDGIRTLPARDDAEADDAAELAAS
jgi:hypothetical protein